VLGLPDPDLGEQVVAAIVRRQTGTTPESLEADLITRCRDQLAAYKKPRRVVLVDALPRNALGKVQKHVLKEQLVGE
jgi:malonyl-CoA/methylmalonyl-CoA synthetase